MSEPINNILVEIIDEQWELLHSFVPKMGESFVDAAADQWIEIETSCCSGACYTCAHRVVEWGQDIDKSLVSEPLVDIEDNEMLTCIGGLKDDVFRDGKFHRIVLQKLL